jgi:5-methylcytosine-specific restriction endonuclease McrA
MKEQEIRKICNLTYSAIGVRVSGAKNPTEARSGLSFWFENYNRSNGPIFSIRPAGLKRHVISMKFGVYASDCIEHIISRASAEDYAVARGLVKQLDDRFEVKLSGNEFRVDWNIEADFQLVVERKIADQLDESSILESVISVMIPMMAAIAELIGYEENPEEGVIEGGIRESIIRKRERNPRSRILCLSLHGEYCGVCGVDPRDEYSIQSRSILEVHHIEPLSESDSPRVYDPALDLIPLCPNCHRAIHTRDPAYTPCELKELLL